MTTSYSVNGALQRNGRPEHQQRAATYPPEMGRALVQAWLDYRSIDATEAHWLLISFLVTAGC